MWPVWACSEAPPWEWPHRSALFPNKINIKYDSVWCLKLHSQSEWINLKWLFQFCKKGKEKLCQHDVIILTRADYFSATEKNWTKARRLKSSIRRKSLNVSFVRATATPTGWTQQHLETSEHAFYKSFRCSCHFVSTSIRSINPWSNNQRASCPAAQQEIPQYFKLLQYSSTQVPPAPTVSSVDWSHLHCFNQILMFDCKHEGFSKLRPLLTLMFT